MRVQCRLNIAVFKLKKVGKRGFQSSSKLYSDHISITSLLKRFSLLVHTVLEAPRFPTSHSFSIYINVLILTARFMSLPKVNSEKQTGNVLVINFSGCMEFPLKLRREPVCTDVHPVFSLSFLEQCTT